MEPHACGGVMAEQFDPKKIVTLDGLAISNMWETSALVEVVWV